MNHLYEKPSEKTQHCYRQNTWEEEEKKRGENRNLGKKPVWITQFFSKSPKRAEPEVNNPIIVLDDGDIPELEEEEDIDDPFGIELEVEGSLPNEPTCTTQKKQSVTVEDDSEEEAYLNQTEQAEEGLNTPGDVWDPAEGHSPHSQSLPPPQLKQGKPLFTHANDIPIPSSS